MSRPVLFILTFVVFYTILLVVAYAEVVEELNNNYGNGDLATFNMESQWSGVLTYDNTSARSSQTGTWPITHEGVTCHIDVVVGDAEQVTIECDGQYEAHPRKQNIPDGETFDFYILYLGG